MPLTDVAGRPSVKISSATLSQIAIATQDENHDGWTCWANPRPDGMEITIVAPDGSRAWDCVPYSELTDDRVPSGGFRAIVHHLKRKASLPSKGLLLPFGRIV